MSTETRKLSPEELHFASVKFQLRLLQSDGQAYEDLFVAVMRLRCKEFKPVKPHGSAGDRKNDGYIEKTGSYYQVYAPEDASKKITDAIEKAKTDFEGLKEFWDSIAPIKEFRFVFNDKFKGPYPDVEKTLSAIGKQNNLAVCRCMLAQHLQSEFMELKDHEMMEIIGVLPSPANIANLDFSIFTDVIRHVLANPTKRDVAALLRVPDFNEKIKFNDISEAVGGLLTNASFQAGAVTKFFEKNGNVSKKIIRDKLADIYEKNEEIAAQKPLAKVTKGDQIFFAVLEEIVPKQMGAVQDAAIVLMAHFFESCDIYKDPILLT